MSTTLKALAIEAAVGHFFADRGNFTPEQVLEALANNELPDDMLLWEPFQHDSLKMVAAQIESMIDWLAGLMVRAIAIGNEEPGAAPSTADTYPLTDAEYVRKGGGVCPSCGSDQIEGNSVNIDGPTADQRVSCLDCDADWTDFYRLAGYTNLVT
ncbi:MAG: hypothetical protein OEL20_05000 [Sulfuritalea sp.]|nr:hypothetical protein [Sulfuritalea sp.]